MKTQLKSFGVLLLSILYALVLPVVAGATYECALEKRNDEQVCVFRGVVYRAKDANNIFKAPTSTKVQHVVFEDSSLDHIPGEFLSAFPDLKALNVVQANLSSVVIPVKLERLYASNNRISKVIVHQTKDNTAMLELMLDSNQLSDISNLTRLVKLEILVLSGNKMLPVDNRIDLGWFKGMDNLRNLMLSDVDMLYLENEENVALPSLELLDVSKNYFTTRHLDMGVLAPMKELQYLWIMHTQIADLNVLQLTKNNPRLKEVHLEGSNFMCSLQSKIVNHLNSAGIATPVSNKNAACYIGHDKRNDMCCQPDPIGSASPVPVPVPVGKDGSTETPSETTFKGTEVKSTNTPTVLTRVTTLAPSSNERTPPTDSSPKGTQSVNKDSASTMVSLGSGMLSLTFAVIFTVALF